eukprot:TRINITY_DN10502_c0_g2_i1.p1 TRINITY_DN10502_c0_g2~~TRINITY_DN10502_c0_g2_i1.p1  ORF type:complete len:478 (+),score=74.84 TRINITY_DN10502_c0_g2_i1:51-1484(+)
MDRFFPGLLKKFGIKGKTEEQAPKRRKSKQMVMLETLGTLENGRATNYYFHQWRMKEIGGLIFSVMTFGLSALQYEAQYQDINQEKGGKRQISTANKWLLYLISLNAIGQMIMRILRYRAMLSYYKKRNVYPQSATLYNTGHLKSLIFELLIIIPHPNILTEGMSFTLTSPYNKKSFEQQVNDVLNLIQLIQVIFMIRMMLSLSYYFNASSHRIMTLTSIKPDYMFVTRCLFKTYPLMFIGLSFVISVLIFSFALRICERPLILSGSNEQDYQDYTNCIWNTLITMATIGYGDYFPRTMYGRLVATCTGVWGIFLTSILVTALMNNLRLEPSEAKAFTIMERKQTKEEMQKLSAKVICKATALQQAKRRGDEISQKETIELMGDLYDLKVLRGTYENLIHEGQTVSEEMNRSMTLLKNDMRQVRQLIYGLSTKKNIREGTIKSFEVDITEKSSRYVPLQSPAGRKNTSTPSEDKEQE